MTAPDDDGDAIAAAVAAARKAPGALIVVPASIAAIPGGREAFEALARETGRRLGAPSHDPVLENAQARAAQSTDVPVIARGDDEAFLKNLKAIAAGRVRVK